MQVNILHIFAVFGINLQAELNKAKSHPEVAQRLDECKKRAKETYKKMAFDLHPDRGGDEDKFKELSVAFDILEKVQYQPPRPRPMPIFIQIHRRYGSSTTYYDSASTTTTTGGRYSTGGF